VFCSPESSVTAINTAKQKRIEQCMLTEANAHATHLHVAQTLVFFDGFVKNIAHFGGFADDTSARDDRSGLWDLHVHAMAHN